MDFQLSLNSETISAAYPAPPLVVTPETPVRDVFLLLKAQRTSSVLVCEGDALVGIFTERDALRLMADGASLDLPVQDVMSRDVCTVEAGETVGAAIQKMAAGGYRRLPITDDNSQPQGVAGVRGIVHYLVEHFPETIYNLPPEPNVVPAEREGA